MRGNEHDGLATWQSASKTTTVLAAKFTDGTRSRGRPCKRFKDIMKKRLIMKICSRSGTPERDKKPEWRKCINAGIYPLKRKTRREPWDETKQQIRGTSSNRTNSYFERFVTMAVKDRPHWVSKTHARRRNNWDQIYFGDNQSQPWLSAKEEPKIIKKIKK